jgi:predicted HicB family RNase H-like nuclease
MMEYKGYRAAVSFDSDAGVFHGEVVDTRDVIVFEGRSAEQLPEEFRFSIDDYLAVWAASRTSRSRGRLLRQTLESNLFECLGAEF